MPTNNILLFDQNKGNMLNDSAYNTNQQRLNGVQSGIASSQLQNKFQYQVSLVAYAIASIMYNNGMDANDADAVSAFVSNMSNTLVQKVLDKASTQEAQAGTVDTKWMSPSLVKAAIDFTSVKLSGSTMTGPLTLSGDPTENLQAATKQYVDSSIGGIGLSVRHAGTINSTSHINTTWNDKTFAIVLKFQNVLTSSGIIVNIGSYKVTVSTVAITSPSSCTFFYNMLYLRTNYPNYVNVISNVTGSYKLEVLNLNTSLDTYATNITSGTIKLYALELNL